jgi:hypothetical protein
MLLQDSSLVLGDIKKTTCLSNNPFSLSTSIVIVKLSVLINETQAMCISMVRAWENFA